MSNIIAFEGKVPAHLAGLEQANADLTGGVGAGGFPVISYKGKVWHVVDGESKTLVTKPGEDDPSSSLEVVILKANPNLSKVFYARGYEEGSNEKPTCYSNDGKGPAADAQEPQAKSCATCPHNAWGSRVSENGSKGKACSDSRRLAVAPAGDMEYPMLLRVPAGTLKELAAYAESLNRRRVGYSAVVTKIAFDHSVAHQKFTFKGVRFITPEEAEAVHRMADSSIVQQIIGLAPVVEHEDDLGEPPAHLANPKPAAPAKTLVPSGTSRAKKAATVDIEEVEQAVAPAKAKSKFVSEPAAPAPAPTPSKKVDHGALLEDANASLEDVLSALDD